MIITAKLKMQKFEVISLIEDSKSVIDYLQRKGVTELTKHEIPDGMCNLDTSYSVNQLQKFLDTANKAQEILAGFAEQKSSLIDSFKPPEEIELQSFLTLADETDKTMSCCYDVLELEKSISQARTETVRLETVNSSLSVWQKLDVPIKCKPTKYVEVLTGTFPDLQTEETIKTRLAELLPEIETVEAEVVYSSEVYSCAAVMCMRSDSQAVLEALRSFGFSAPSEMPKKPAGEIISENLQKIEKLKNKISQSEKEIKELSSKYDDISFLIDYLTLRIDKYEALKKISVTNRIFYLSGFVPEKHSEKLTKKLEEKFSCAVLVTEPDEDEEVPVLLSNNSFAAPVEGITEMYSMPGKNDIDPNAIMGFFYYVFFGMMFSDAGYGLLMFLATAFVLFKCKPEGNKRKTVLMYMYCGISTMFWGIMFGSFFGDVINTIRVNYLNLPEMRLYVWLNPQGDDLMLTMLWCFLFGIIHLFTGVAIKGYMTWRQGDKLGAVFDVASIYLAVGGIAPVCAGMIIDIPPAITNVGKYCALVGVVLIILTAGRASKGIFGKLGSGLYALYNAVSGYLSDILSYSRLLALGLVTGIIGNVVNMMGTLPQNTVVKTVLFAVVFVLGHTINFGINIIGAYVHTNRLQYVEFFSRFYEGGGVAFNPLKVNSKSFKLKEENNNG